MGSSKEQHVKVRGRGAVHQHDRSGPAEERLTAQGSGLSCDTYQALGPRAGDCAVARYPDSTAMTACTRSGSTPCRRAAE